MFTCPHCHDLRINWWAKSVAFKFAPAVCPACGGKSYVPELVPIWLMLFTATAGGFAAVVTGLLSRSLGGVVLLAAMIVALVAQLGFNRDNLRPSS